MHQSNLWLCWLSLEAYPDFARKLCAKSIALDVKLETAVQIIKKAYSEVPSFDYLLDALLSSPLQEVHKACNLTPGVPVVPMLAKPTKSVAEVLKRLDGQRFTCEYKYDGERAQVHQTPDGTTKVFSRNLLNTSEKFPEVPLYVKEACKDESVTSFVLDTEVVGKISRYFVDKYLNLCANPSLYYFQHSTGRPNNSSHFRFYPPESAQKNRQRVPKSKSLFRRLI